MAIYRSSMDLDQLLNRLHEVAARGNRVDESGVSYWGNSELHPGSDLVLPGSKLDVAVNYAQNNRTLSSLHTRVDPVGGSVWLVNRYSNGEARLRVTNMTLLQTIVSANSVAVMGNAYEYKLTMWSNGRAYSGALEGNLHQTVSEVL